MFTLIQIVCLAILWAVKSSSASLALPFILILTIPLRMLMTGRLFTVFEMKCVSIYSIHIGLKFTIRIPSFCFQQKSYFVQLNRMPETVN